MLAAADPAADRALAAHDLRQQAGGVVEPGQVVAVAPVVAEDVVAGAQQARHRHGHDLLAQARVGRAVELALREQVQQGAFEMGG